ncbi:MAG: hypothetical protein K0B81_03005 [Candidatus Cloacimonetes bacterium]|nr:hypothetical protein [Candidatus Cloacimonadota bacterium]
MTTFYINTRFICSFFLIALLLSLLHSYDLSDFESTAEEGLIIRYHSRDKQLMETLFPMILNDIYEFQRSLGFYPELQGEIIIAPDREYYQHIVSGYSGIIEFSEAVYISSHQRIYIRNPRDLRDFSRLRKIILHEYIHLFLDSHFYNVPLWFHEGMAVFFSGDLTFDRELIYARDYLLGNSLTLNEMISRYPTSRIRWGSFYAKSGLAVKYLYANQRNEFYALWQYSKEPKDFNITFLRAFGMTPNRFSGTFEEHLRKRFRIEMLLAFTGIVWSLLPFILLLAWLRKKWLNKKIQQTWEDTQQPEEESSHLPEDNPENEENPI